MCDPEPLLPAAACACGCPPALQPDSQLMVPLPKAMSHADVGGIVRAAMLRAGANVSGEENLCINCTSWHALAAAACMQGHLRCALRLLYHTKSAGTESQNCCACACEAGCGCSEQLCVPAALPLAGASGQDHGRHHAGAAGGNARGACSMQRLWCSVRSLLRLLNDSLGWC